MHAVQGAGPHHMLNMLCWRSVAKSVGSGVPTDGIHCLMLALWMSPLALLPGSGQERGGGGH